MPVPTRRIDPTFLKQFVSVIRAGNSIEINYQSMNHSRPGAIWRRITPHAFAHDGLRWHVRAFCHIDSKFKDFILSRCQGLERPGPETYLDDVFGAGEEGFDAESDAGDHWDR
jgi:predicted DNA-binding transcriptional regulator YafY